MNNRTSFLIDPKVQWALIRRLMMHWCLMLLALVSAGVVIELFSGDEDVTFLGAIKSSFGTQGPLIVLMFLLVPVYLHDVVKISHRFAGPMLRLRRILKSLAKGGNGAQLKFRPGDFWQETADDFNRFYAKHMETRKRCKCLEDHIRKLRCELKKAQKLAEAAQTKAQTPSQLDALPNAKPTGKAICRPRNLVAKKETGPQNTSEKTSTGTPSDQPSTEEVTQTTTRSAQLVDLDAFPPLVEQPV